MPTVSALARLMRVIVLGIAFAALAWLAWCWPRSPAWAVAGALAIGFGHAWLLALQFALMRVASTEDPAGIPRFPVMVRAWYQEALEALRVFGWRQAFAWRQYPDQPGAVPGATGIVFVHGFMCNRGFWAPWLAQARSLGIPYATVNLEPVYTGIDAYAPLIERAVETLTRATGRPPVLVCHSMGGLAARAWLRGAGPGRVAHVVTIGSPHGGTWIARFSHVANGRQMRMDSSWIRSLAESAVAAREPFTCWYSDCDNMVFPPATATLPGADNRLVRGVAHVELAFQPEVMQRTFSLVQAL